ncbi:beta-glucosidase family protein [Sphingomonas abietis]|uniref:Beta-glucosidase n=1 Tax=Sphingomonas abietis TaxID=3012344 RepID=A0ABY7NR34_9SPHN|nr:beta-glucosidase [Sphingomonas abietis]WBO21951.1 beta-glucosidase [Sphingomonas abietis]
MTVKTSLIQASLKPGIGLALLLSSTMLAAQAPARSGTALAERVDALIGKMTLDEKIAMVNGTFGSALLKTKPDEKRNGAGHVPGVARLGIPDLFESDASLGVANGGEMRKGDVATALPSSLATAASFEPQIAYVGGAMIGAEARAKGFNVLLSGGANLTRDPWNGRNFEYLGEDVWLTGVMAGASIQGVQSNDIVSTMKHFALNAQESGRNVLDARMAEAPMRESDLLAFEIANERGQPGSVMCGYNHVNGDYDCENAFLLNDVLKRDWGFKGWVMSDWGAVHSTVKAVNAGLDQESGQELDTQPFFAAPLKAAVMAGSVPQARLDDMVRRILRTMIAHGLVDHPTPTTPQAIDYDAHAEIAQRAAEAGIVLLRNDGLLPLAATARHILVIGSHADKGVLSGGGSSQVRSVGGLASEEPMPGGGPLSSFIKVSYHASSPLDAIRKRAPGAEVRYLDGEDAEAAAAAARSADIVLVFAHQWRTEAVDVDTLALPDGQDALIDAVASANPKTVVILETGGAVLMPWRDKVGAVLEAWYPGQRGGPAIARVLFGEVNPGGRLPLTFPASEAQAPRPQIPGLASVKAAAARNAGKPAMLDLSTVDLTGGVAEFTVDYPEGADVGYRWYAGQGTKPLYPFGFGLSYSQFAYSRLTLAGGRTPTISFRVTNTGKRAGADVPQVYANVALGKGAALPRLVGFERVVLKPGETRTVSVTIDPRLIARYDGTARAWKVAAGSLPIMVGTDVQTPVLSGTVAVPALSLPAEASNISK